MAQQTTAPGVLPGDKLDLVVHGATAFGVALCCDVTVVSPLTSTGRPLLRAATDYGTALQLARARKHCRRWWAVLACALQRATASTLLGGGWLGPAQTTANGPTLEAVLDWADALSRLPLR